MTHPLLVAYRTCICDMYGERVGKVDSAKVEEKAMKISRLGLSYDEYVDLAVRLNHKWAMHSGWKYPYWNVIACDATIARIRELLELNESFEDAVDALFDAELSYATAYVDWYLGKGKRPRRIANVENAVKSEVAERICAMNGIECISSNYNWIAQEIQRIHG